MTKRFNSIFRCPAARIIDAMLLADGDWTVVQILKTARISSSTLYEGRYLETLLKEEILIERKVGKLSLYKLNTKHWIFKGMLYE